MGIHVQDVLNTKTEVKPYLTTENKQIPYDATLMKATLSPMSSIHLSSAI